MQMPLTVPGVARGKAPACQWRRHKKCGFDPWVGRIPWRRAWLSTPIFFSGESHGQRSLAGYSIVYSVAKRWTQLKWLGTHACKCPYMDSGGIMFDFSYLSGWFGKPDQTCWPKWTQSPLSCNGEHLQCRGNRRQPCSHWDSPISRTYLCFSLSQKLTVGAINHQFSGHKGIWVIEQMGVHISAYVFFFSSAYVLRTRFTK